MDGLMEFLHMGGYGLYVWPAFGVTVVVLLTLLVASLRTLRSREGTLAELQRRAESRPGRARRSNSA